MKYLLKTAQASSIRFIYDGPQLGSAEPVAETAREETERAEVCTKSHEECEQLSTEVESGLAVTPNLVVPDAETPPVVLANADVISGGDGDEVAVEQTDDDGVNTEPSPHLPHFENLRTQTEYETVSDEEFSAAQTIVLAKLENGGLVVPEDIAEDPEAVNAWLEEQMDLELEGHEDDPAARADEYMAGQGTTMTPEQRQTYTQQIEAARSANPDLDPNSLTGLIVNLLREMGIISEDDNGLFYDTTTYGDYNGPNVRAGNNGRPYSGEVYQGGFGMNESFYGVNNLRTQLESNPQLLEQVTNAVKKFPEEWHGAIYRNATNNPQFRADQPILLHNISTATAALWLPGQDQASLHPATHGYGGIGNKSGSGATSIGSYRLRDMPDGGKLKARMGMEGLEKKTNNYQSPDVQDAYGVDPASIGNSNSDNRLERVHEIRGSRTAGCTGLPLATADRLDSALASSGGGMMERFVSDPTA